MFPERQRRKTAARPRRRRTTRHNGDRIVRKLIDRIKLLTFSALAVGAIAACSAFAPAPQAFASPVELCDLLIPRVQEDFDEEIEVPSDGGRVVSRNRNVKKIDPKSESVPFTGIAAKSAEEQDKATQDMSPRKLIDAANALQKARMTRDAIFMYKKALKPEASEKDFTEALRGYVNYAGAFQGDTDFSYNAVVTALEEAIKARPDSWYVKKTAADLYSAIPGVGYFENGEFVYSNRWRDNMASAEERIYVRKMRLYSEALPLVRKEAKALLDYYAEHEKDGVRFFDALPGDLMEIRDRVNGFYLSFRQLFLQRGASEYWRLQTLTDLSTTPDYVPVEYARRSSNYNGAPVDANGDPIFYAIPESYEAAKNDGERLQALYEEGLLYCRTENAYRQVCNERASYANELFGVHTLRSYRFFFNDDAVGPDGSSDEGVWSLHTLGDSETIAKLANGVKRFELPKHYDYLALWYEALECGDQHALNNIAQEYQNRRQYNKAADAWKTLIERSEGALKEQAEASLSQIVDPRVRFDDGSSVRGLNADLVVRFRNATAAKVVVESLNVDELLTLVRKESFWKKSQGGNVESTLQRLIMNECFPAVGLSSNGDSLKDLFRDKKIVGERVASFDLTLDPDPDHYDRVTPIKFPTREPGAYLVEVSANNGNRDYAVVWLRDIAIVSKPYCEDSSAEADAAPQNGLRKVISRAANAVRRRGGDKGGRRFFVLDSTTGEPKPNEKVEFFFVMYQWNNGKQIVDTKSASMTTDENGSVFVGNEYFPESKNTSVLTIVPRKGESKKAAVQFGIMDLQGMYRVFTGDEQFENLRAFFVSDRPIYRPKQTAKFKFIVGSAQYDAPEKNSWGGKDVVYTIGSPSGEEVAKKRVTLDEFGAFSDTFELPSDAQLGEYYVGLMTSDETRSLGGGSFQLEEYRKPEFQVTVDAPKDPVALGDSFKAKVNAKYYFGAPVTNANVSYRVTRTNYRSTFFPSRYWDWFYGVGYWQFTYDCEWYPGWLRWGCFRLPPFYEGRSNGVPEVVASGEARIDAEGNFEIEIDSSLAKLLYPNDDQQYEISVDVTDQSRRTISGVGKVYAAREPFKTYVWFDRGYYRVGDKMQFGFQARRLDGKSVDGNAVVKLFKIAYEPTDDGSVKPIETEIFAQELKTNAEGKGVVALTAAEPGQYRASCVVTTESGVAEEGAQLIVVRSGAANSNADDGELRFNELEIVPDKPEYSVGDVAKIQIASSRKDACVLWTARPRNGAATDGVNFVKLTNGAAYIAVPIETADQPNIFVQAWTVFDGRLYQEQKELAVPPEKRVLDVAVEPSAERVKPGEKASIKLRLTDPDGKPVVGQTVVTVYDKSLDALSGGSNVEDIREFFWKWRRYSNLNTISNLDWFRWRTMYDASANAQRGKNTPLMPIGAFGTVMTMGLSGAMNGAMGAMGAMDGGMGVKSRARMAMAKAAPTMAARREASDMMAAPAEADMAMDDAVMEMEEAAPAAAMAPMMDEAKSEEAAPAPDAGDAPLVEAKVRKNLADAAYWNADLKSDDDGVIEIEVEMPENLTTWRVCAWTVGDGLRVGSGEAEILTSKDVIVRMQKPRFLTQKDEAFFTANVHNYLGSEKQVQVSLDVTGPIVLADGVEAVRTIVVPANGEARVDWTVNAVGNGTSTVVMKALTNEESDAIEETIEVKEHGILKQIPVSGVVPPADKAEEGSDAQEQVSNASNQVRESTFTLTIPEERRAETTNLVVRFSPTLAGAIFDAIPYLTEYPYGCTEQTLNRFLPLVLTQKALQDSGVDLASLASKQANLNAQEIGDAQERAAQWKKLKRTNSAPVFDVAKVRSMTEQGVAKLQSMQCSDGGWGWFSGPGEHSNPYLTALVARGLKLAQNCDCQVDVNTLVRATQWLINYEREQAARIIRGKVWTEEQKREPGAWRFYKESADSTDAAVYAALSELDVQPAGFDEKYVDYDKAELVAKSQFAVHSVMKELLWEARGSLDLYPLASFAIALTNEPNKTADLGVRIETLLGVLSQYRQADDENQTVWLALDRFNGWRYWCWHGGEYETQAYYLRLLQRVEPETLKKLGLEEDAPRLVKYLLNNRKNATYWNSTRDTAFCVEAFVEYLQKTNELAPKEKVEVLVDGEVKKTVEYTPENLFETDGTLALGPDELSAGDHTITLRVDGDGPLYYNAYLEFFTLEDPIKKAGLELKTERRYYKLVERKDASLTVEGSRGQAVDQRVELYDRVPLASGDAVKSGDKIEVELIVDSKNEYESILLEDLKPAGFEAVESRSGYDGNAMGAYVEYRDDRVCFFCSRLAQGRSSVKYQLRAETPGKFSALPTKIWAMYAPELKGNADEFKTQVDDRD